MNTRLDELRSLLENPTSGVMPPKKPILNDSPAKAMDLPKSTGYGIPFTVRKAPVNKPNGYKDALLKRSRATGKHIKIIPSDGVTQCTCDYTFSIDRYWCDGEWLCRPCAAKLNVI